MTGAPLPPGADAVVMVEDTEPLDGGHRVRIRRSVARRRSRCGSAGDDVRRGDLLFPAGTVVRPAVLGVLASVGHLRDPGGAAGAGRRAVDRRRAGRGRCAARAGPDPREQPDDAPRRAGRRPGACRSTSASCATTRRRSRRRCARPRSACDAIVTSGGVSMGDFDVVKVVLDRMADDALDADRHQAGQAVRLRPARRRGSTGAGVRAARQPGVVARQLRAARPAGAAADDGAHRATRSTVPGSWPSPTTGFVRRPDGKVHWDRVHGAFGADGRFHVRSTGAQGSHQLAATAAANGLAVRPRRRGRRAGRRRRGAAARLSAAHDAGTPTRGRCP